MSRNFTFDWFLPEAVFGEDLNEDDLQRRVQEGVVISLFKEGRVSSGLAAEMLGLSKRQFLQLLYDKGVPYFDLSLYEACSYKQDKLIAQKIEKLPKALQREVLDYIDSLVTRKVNKTKKEPKLDWICGLKDHPIFLY